MLIAEAIRTAQKKSGKKTVDAIDVRAGLESLDIDAARIKEIGLDGFMTPVKVTCDDHSGSNDVLRPTVGRGEVGEGVGTG